MQRNRSSELLCVGILGGGQLGSMLARSIQKLGHQVAVYDASEAAPALKQTDRAFVGAWDSRERLQQFLNCCDVVTYEFENVETPMLRELLSTTNRPIIPSLDVLETSQNRRLEKEFLRKHNIPCAHFIQVETIDALLEAVAQMGFPCILKTTRFGYDGKGQWRIPSRESLKKLLPSLASNSATLFPCTLEEELPLATEASVITCRSRKKEIVTFPVAENLHEKHILAFTMLPSRLPADVCDTLAAIGRDVASALSLEGILAIEFFLTREPARHNQGRCAGEYRIFVNEIAPRPHNSGHVTMAACTISQFDALARILCDVPLTEPRMVAPRSYCMGNLLGDLWPKESARLPLDLLRTHPDVIDVLLYGKPEAKAGRKMGHFVVCADSPEAALHGARAFRNSLAAGDDSQL